ncbi:MAG TPA: GyrI-like domain-containing protein [Flavobacteriaceae bacterium]|nr:GyrI-like domain-containing protein [Flavobacteriaceae bacterium]
MKNTPEAFRLIGLKLPNKTSNENNRSSTDCGHLWQQFETEKIINRIPDKLSDEIYAVYFDYEPDDKGLFSYFIGCKVPENVVVPEGLEALTIPGQHYIRFTAKGKMTGCISDAWKAIRQADLNREYAFDFEVYGQKSYDWNNAEVPIYISVKP